MPPPRPAPAPFPWCSALAPFPGPACGAPIPECWLCPNPSAAISSPPTSTILPSSLPPTHPVPLICLCRALSSRFCSNVLISRMCSCEIGSASTKTLLSTILCITISAAYTPPPSSAAPNNTPLVPRIPHVHHVPVHRCRIHDLQHPAL
ncbi:hypothetical protein B0H14DRAFT_3528478 [Mycena olivaceomarginata]|nr:hypothetical protein B0H14DRAFT_3528478 [Mycena olivaceomarginata]